MSPATGIDNLSHQLFVNSKEKYIENISRKTIEGRYKFTKYKLKLVSKGQGKVPREISIPTIRDRITLRALCDFLKETFKKDLDFHLPQEIIRDIKKELSTTKYDAFIKLDISDFYPSIDHKILIRTLGKRIRSKEVIDFISKAIQASTVVKSRFDDEINKKGVPQGLSISNVLAAIYLSNLDRYINAYENIKYYRYVDDVLILCCSDSCKGIVSDITKRFKRLKLKVHEPSKNSEKSTIGMLEHKGFSYLGYVFQPGLITARLQSVERLRDSIVAIFSGYKYSKIKNVNFLEWRLNTRITGCVFQNKYKGWVFFFSEITNENLLHELDHFVQKLCDRYSVKLNLKSFVRTFFQANHSRHEGSYIPNFDKYDEQKMVEVLEVYFNKNTKNLTSEQIKYSFLKRITKEVKDLETDIKDAGY